MVYSVTKVIFLVFVILQFLVKNTYPQSTAKCGVSQISETKLILHGYETVPGEWPWQAAVYRRKRPSDTYVCGGTLVSERFLLTAAHCAISDNGHQMSYRNIFVRLGVHNLDELIRTAVQQHAVSKIVVHPNYSNEAVHNDIAILELATLAEFNKYVQPACLGLTRDLTGLFGTTIGWGMTEIEEISPTLKSSRMPVVDYLTCLKSDRAVFGETLSEMILCAGYTNGTSICNGDSGSGLFIQQDSAWYLGGIVSYKGARSQVDQRCSTTGYGAFTNVRMYLQWISSVTALQMKVSIETSQQLDIVPTNSTFFDCSTHLTCTQCVSSQFPCDWCTEAHRCTNDAVEICRNDILVTDVSRKGPGSCPSIYAPGGESQEIMVASGTKMQIKVKVHGIDSLRVQTTKFVCQFNIEGQLTSVNAQLQGDVITCGEMEFAYGAKTPNLTVTFAVTWDDSKPLDNPNNIGVLIYSCKEMSDSCGVCLALYEKYQCGWCSSSDTCELEHQCVVSDENKGQKKDWLNSQQTCPNPVIHSFEPKSGPWEGGTNITIRVLNLDAKFDDIYGIQIAGIYCKPFREMYIQAKMIVCQVDGLDVKNHLLGPVGIQISDFRVESTNDFAFVDPEITDFTPKLGPIAGGTIITIIGKKLNTGSRIKVFVDQYPCEILSLDENEVTCRTTAILTPTLGKLRMVFDNGVREINAYNFEYVLNPAIEYVTSGDPGQTKTTRGSPAGGTKIYVAGQNFFSIEKPKMYVYYRHQMFLNECKSTSNKVMQCLSPKIDLSDVDILQSDEPLRLEYGFIMDDVTSVKNLSSKLESWFELYPNPVYYPFKQKLENFNCEYLIINGRNLNLVYKESDVTVKIGDNVICSIISLARNQLTCQPPMDQDIHNMNVVVVVGNGLTYDIGQMSYSSSNTLQIVLLAIGFTILFVVFVCLCIILCQTIRLCILKHRLR